jgi:predicted RNA binding protein YcfA (HicA-like mRNA interferase family)
MPRIPGIRHRDAVRVFERLGYRIARESGHIIMSNGKVRLVILRNNPIDSITMGGIAKAAGLTPDQFRELM